MKQKQTYLLWEVSGELRIPGLLGAQSVKSSPERKNEMQNMFDRWSLQDQYKEGRLEKAQFEALMLRASFGTTAILKNG